MGLVGGKLRLGIADRYHYSWEWMMQDGGPFLRCSSLENFGDNFTENFQ